MYLPTQDSSSTVNFISDKGSRSSTKSDDVNINELPISTWEKHTKNVQNN